MSSKNRNLENPSPTENARLGLLIAHHGVAVRVRWDEGAEELVRVGRKSGFLVGDRVFKVGEKLKRQERQTTLQRATTAGHTLSLAANIDFVGVVIAPQPETKFSFVDQVIMASSAARIESFILINKCDLDAYQDLAEQVRRHYGESVEVFPISALHAQGLTALHNAFAQKGRGVLVGASGVGKSSLVNALRDDKRLQVGALSEASGFGKHTTTTATLSPLPQGGEIVDTPGVREFIPVAVKPHEVAAHFPGFAAVLSAPCRFHDCLHRKEPQCVVKEAVDNNQIPLARYQSYLALLEQTEKQQVPAWH